MQCWGVAGHTINQCVKVRQTWGDGGRVWEVCDQRPERLSCAGDVTTTLLPLAPPREVGGLFARTWAVIM